MKRIFSLLRYFFRILIENFSYHEKTIYKKDVKTPYKIMSFNIRRDVVEDGVFNWKFRKHYCSQIMRNADIICVQEVMPHACKYLISQLGNDYDCYSSDTVLGMKLEKNPIIFTEGLAIFYDKNKYKLIDSGKFWLSETPNRVSRSWGSPSPRIAIYVTLDNKETGERNTIINTHFCHKVSEARQHSAEIINEFMKKHLEFVYIAGDFNCSYNSPELDALNKNFRHNVTSKAGTFCGFEGKKNKIIDMIFTREEYKTKILSEKYNSYNISDHNPIVLY